MKEGWEYRKLGECCITTNNIRWTEDEPMHQYIDLSSVDRETSLISNTESVNIDNAPSRAKQIIKIGDVIFATTRPTLKRVAVIDEKYDGEICSTGFCVLRPISDLLDTRFLFNLLKADDFYKYIEPLQTGASYPAVTDRIVKNYVIPVPPLSEQQRIVTYLDSSFSKIDELKENVAKELSEAKALFQAELKKCMVKKDGWEEKKLGEVCSKISDGSHNPPRGVEHSEYLMLSSKNIRNDKFTFDNPRYLSSLDFERENQRTNVEKGDVLLTIVGAGLGDCCMYPSDKKVVFQRSAAVIKTCKDILLSRFLMYLIQANLDKIRKESNGAAQKGIYLNQLKEYKISLPNIFSQRQIVTHLDTLSQKIQELEKNYNIILAECDALKQAILRETFE